MADYKKILVLLDLTDASEQVAVAASRDMAAHSNAAMVLLHVVEFVPAEPMGETLMPTVQIEEDLEQRAELKLNELSARLGLSRVTARVEAGNKKTEILRVAEGRSRRFDRARQPRAPRSRHLGELYRRHRLACRALRRACSPLQ